MTQSELEAAYPELFEAARFLRSRAVAGGGKDSDVRLRCIVAADGTLIAGKLPEPDPPGWVYAIKEGPRPWDPKPEPVAKRAPYRGRHR